MSKKCPTSLSRLHLLPTASRRPLSPAAENPGQVTLDGTTTPVGTDKPKPDPPGKEAPAAGQKTEPKQKDGKVIDITGKAAARTEPVKKPTAPEKAAKAEKPGKSDKPGKGRPPKADKAAPKPDKKQRDKVSQSKDTPEQPAAGGPGSGPAVVDAPAEPAPPLALWPRARSFT